jgi:hypothetical protein
LAAAPRPRRVTPRQIEEQFDDNLEAIDMLKKSGPDRDILPNCLLKHPTRLQRIATSTRSLSDNVLSPFWLTRRSFQFHAT